MKGFVLKLTKAKNEDLIVSILTQDEHRVYYRFFGARHSILQLGHLIDFEVYETYQNFLPQIRHLSHIGFPWIREPQTLLLWHQFIYAYEKHLKDTTYLDSFYYLLLQKAVLHLEKQNPKRVICDCYFSLLKEEGRLSLKNECFICQNPLNETVIFIQGLKMTHPQCLHGIPLSKKRIIDALKRGKTTFLNDEEVSILHHIILQGF
jgi:recombinational DNA repair protein (RecF pathway)